MVVQPIKTQLIRASQTDICSVLDSCVPSLDERSILVITSKIVSLCEGRVAPLFANKDELVRQESEYYLSPEDNTYGISLAQSRDLLIPAAGIDESNADGQYVLWPFDPQKTANDVRSYLSKRFSLKEIGVLITDSKTTPLRWGTTGVALAHSGFAALNDRIGTPDLFGRPLEVTKVNVRDGLAAAAVVVMGEAAEKTPLAVVSDVPFVEFQDHDPTKEELNALVISISDDIYGAILKRAPWKKGNRTR